MNNKLEAVILNNHMNYKYTSTETSEERTIINKLQQREAAVQKVSCKNGND